MCGTKSGLHMRDNLLTVASQMGLFHELPWSIVGRCSLRFLVNIERCNSCRLKRCVKDTLTTLATIAVNETEDHGTSYTILILTESRELIESSL